MPKFRSRNDEGGVTIHSVGLAPINILRGETYESEDKAVVKVLRGSPEVEEVKAAKGGRPKHEDDE